MKSTLVIFDLATGRESVILETDRHIEAPNWSPDDNTLIVNSDGLLFRVSLAEPELALIDTGFANDINNDHGISPDGSLLAISDSSRTEQSCIYTVDIKGGEPKRVTDHVPSYWHGWSPDGRTLTYTARREDNYQIFTCPVGGGSEFQVTSDFYHCDGPDFTPDGVWIWFNAEQAGSVQLWRVHPDGSELTQMTDDDRVNWFPHPSPNGDKVVYLAYPSGTQGHPANRQVELRVMPALGGSPQVLTNLNGGQGTINVSSWSPDSQRFAFVKYAL